MLKYISPCQCKNILCDILDQNEFFTEYEKATDSKIFRLYLKYRTQLFIFLWNNEVEISYVNYFFLLTQKYLYWKMHIGSFCTDTVMQMYLKRNNEV